MSRIYHITTRGTWQAAARLEKYELDSLSVEGFIHCSKWEQVLRVAETFYLGQRDLLLLEIDPRKLLPELRWEPGFDRPDELFPHIYGPLNLDAVCNVLDLHQGPDGQFILPSV